MGCTGGEDIKTYRGSIFSHWSYRISMTTDLKKQEITRPFAILIRGKWTIDILSVIVDTPVRLGGLKRHIPAASKKALTASLRSLERAGVITRRDLSTSKLHVEYELVEGKRELIQVLMRLLEELDVTFQ
jgi:DNA-binding HxlR family transcriptional regulator